MQHISNTNREKQYVIAVANLKSVQKIQSMENGRVSSDKQSANIKTVVKMQENHVSIASLYGAELAISILETPGIIRKVAHEGRYSLQYITIHGQITIYSYPKNIAVSPKIEVHHPSYGFIAWWYKDDFDLCVHNVQSNVSDDEFLTRDSIWDILCTRYNFDPDDSSAVDAETARILSFHAD